MTKVSIIIDSEDMREILWLLDQYLQILIKEAFESQLPYSAEARGIIDLLARLTINGGDM
jgi:hypothetical protein